MNKKHYFMSILALIMVLMVSSSQRFVSAQRGSDIRTFQDAIYGYQFTYPSTLQLIQQWDSGLNHIVEFKDATTSSMPLKMYVVIGNFGPSYSTLEDWINAQEDDYFGEKIATQSVYLDGVSGIEHVYKNEYEYTIAQYYTRNGKSYLFNMGPLPSATARVQLDSIMKNFEWLPGIYAQQVPTLPKHEQKPIAAPTSPVVLQFPFCGSFSITQGYNQGSHVGQYNAYALDWSLGRGDPVFAAHSGTVTTKWDSTGGGNLLKVETSVSGTQYQTWYAHLLSFAVASGSFVNAGDLVGYADSTGSASTGDHLHFALLQNTGNGFWSILPEPMSGQSGFSNGQQHSRRCSSFNETAGIADTELDTVWWFPWYDSSASNQDWILIGNPGPASAQVEIYIAGTKTSDSPHVIPAGQVWTPQYAGITGRGPVKIVSTNGQPIFASQRVYAGSWAGQNLVASQNVQRPGGNAFALHSGLTKTWWFPWYDASASSRDWIFVANPGPNSAQVEIYIGGNKTSDSPHTIAAGQVWAPEYSGVIGGPVKVVSTGEQSIFVSQRVLQMDAKGFNELTGVNSRGLSTIWWFPWYDSNTPTKDWILVGNPGPNSAQVEIYIGGNITNDSPHTILAGEVWTPLYDGTVGGPVKIVSTNGQSVFASQRVSEGTSGFNEVMGEIQADLSTLWWFPWYEATPPARDWVVVSNPSPNSAQVEVYFGGNMTSDSPHTIPADQVWAPEYPGASGGPVKVISTNGQPILVSQRVSQKGSFNEVMGISGSDTVAPAISIIQQPVAGTWYNTDQTIAFTISDASSGVRGYKLAWDQNPPGGSEVAGASGSISLSSAGQGQHTLYIQAWDNAGNPSAVSAVGWLGYDTVAPANPTSSSPGCTAASRVWQNTCADANFTWSGASDATSGVAGYEVYWGTDPNGTGTLWSTTAAYNPSAVSSGTYYLRVHTKDNASNWSTWLTLFTLRYDGTIPTGSLQINSNASTTHATLVKLHTTASDTHSGLCQMRLRDAGGTWTAWQGYTTSTYWQLPGPTGQTFNIETQFKDCAGNSSATYVDAIALNIYPARPASAKYRIVKSTLGAAGLTGVSTNYRINSTLGQPSMIGQMTSTNYGMTSGYWAVQYTNFAVFLPVILR